MRKILFGLLGLLFSISANAACNLFDPKTDYEAVNYDVIRSATGFTATAVNNPGSNARVVFFIPKSRFKPNTTYYFSSTVTGSQKPISIKVGRALSSGGNTDGYNYYADITSANGSFTISDISADRPYISFFYYLYDNPNGTQVNVSDIMITEGSTATAYTPYDAECIERCKNLFDGELAIGGLLFANGDVTNETQYLYSIRSIPVIPNTSYVLSADTSKIKKGEVYFYKNNGEYNGHISDALKNLPIAFTTPEDTYQVKFILMGSGENLQPSDATNVQLEQGDTATAYVPYHLGCHETNIKIASTKYAETVFNPLNTALQSAISVVDSVVSRTITQAASIATLQSGKQTRPADDTCPAGKKCLLVEGTDGKPHWYEICSSAHCLPDGYTELEYIQSTGVQEIDTGSPLLGTDTVTLKYSHFIRSNNASRMLFGNYFSTYRFAVNFYGSETTNGLFYWGNENQVGFNTPPTNDDLSHIVKFENAKIYIDNDIVVSTHLLTNDFNTGVNMFIFSAGAQSFRSAYRLYYYQHAKADGQMVRDLVPAKRNSDGAIGLYDLVDKQFYTNTGFIAGPVAE